MPAAAAAPRRCLKRARPVTYHGVVQRASFGHLIINLVSFCSRRNAPRTFFLFLDSVNGEEGFPPEGRKLEITSRGSAGDLQNKPLAQDGSRSTDSGISTTPPPLPLRRQTESDTVVANRTIGRTVEVLVLLDSYFVLLIFNYFFRHCGFSR